MSRSAYIVWNPDTQQLEVCVARADGMGDFVLATLPADPPPDENAE